MFIYILCCFLKLVFFSWISIMFFPIHYLFIFYFLFFLGEKPCMPVIKTIFHFIFITKHLKEFY